MRLATVFTQAIQHGCQGCTCGLRQGQRRQCICGVVATANAQRIGRQQALNDQVFLGITGFAARVVHIHGAHQPSHSGDHINAKVTGVAWQVRTEGQVRTQLRLVQLDLHGRRQHLHHHAVVAVEYHQAGRTKNTRLGCGIGLHAAVPVQVVLGDVEHHGRRGLKALQPVELKAGQLQHPGLGQIERINPGAQRIEQGGANIACHGHADACVLQQFAGQRCDGGFAVGTGNCQHLGRVAVGRSHALQSGGKQIQFPAHRQADGTGCIHHGRQHLGGQAGRAVNRCQVLPLYQRR